MLDGFGRIVGASGPAHGQQDDRTLTLGVVTAPHPRCAEVARRTGEDPAGTAGSVDGIIAIAAAGPWPSDLSDHPLIGPVARRLSTTEQPLRYRLQAMSVDSHPDPDNGVHVTHYRRRQGPFRRFEATEHHVPPSQLQALCDRVIRAGDDDPEVAPHRRVLVCTNGRRDPCCGSLGTRLIAEMTSRFDVDIRGTTHTGGHRFAPTAMLLPEGTLWARLDASVLQGILDRSIPPARAARHYRGCLGLDGPASQILDASAFAYHGWSWLDRRRLASVLDDDTTSVRVRLEGHDDAGGIASLEATVSEVGRIPIPICGEPVAAATKTQAVLAVTDLRRNPAS